MQSNLNGLLATLVVLTFALAIWLIWHYYKWSILPNPTSKNLAGKLIQVIDELSLKKSLSICDCGSGLGTLVAKLHHAGYYKAWGIEGSWLIWLVSQVFTLFTHIPRSCLRRGTWQSVFQEADLLIFYISPYEMHKAAKLLEHSSYKGIILTHTFALPGLKPKKVIWYEGVYRVPIYLYFYESCHEKGKT